MKVTYEELIENNQYIKKVGVKQLIDLFFAKLKGQVGTNVAAEQG